MKELIEKLRNYNRWRRGDEAIPHPDPKEVGEIIDQAIEVLEGGGGMFKSCGLRVLNDELSLQAAGWDDVRLLLSKVQLLAVLHDLKWVDVQHEGFTMMVEPDSDIESLAAEFEEWKIKGVNYQNENFIPKEILELVEKGELVQWRKHPTHFFVPGVDKARIWWDESRKAVAHKYAHLITEQEQRTKFVRLYNSLNAVLNCS